MLLSQEASAALPEDMLDTPPVANTLPEISLDSVPDRPENFIPLGCQTGDIQEKIWSDLRRQAKLTGTADNEAEVLRARSDIGAAEQETISHWNRNTAVEQERSCISAN